jgi:hypothetical protein
LIGSWLRSRAFTRLSLLAVEVVEPFQVDRCLRLSTVFVCCESCRLLTQDWSLVVCPVSVPAGVHPTPCCLALVERMVSLDRRRAAFLEHVFGSWVLTHVAVGGL